MKIGIIGADGFLGKELCRVLSEVWEVCKITRENYESVSSNCFKNDYAFDVLINANGNSKKYWANCHPVEDFELSVTSVYKSLLDFKYERYIYISSIDAKMCNTYGFHKRLAERIVSRYCNKYNILRCGAIIGRGMKKGVLKDILKNKELFVTKDSRLTLITNTDIATKLLELIKDNPTDAIFDFSSVNNLSVEEIAELLDREIMTNGDAQHQCYDGVGTKQYFSFKTAEEYIRDATLGFSNEYLDILRKHNVKTIFDVGVFNGHDSLRYLEGLEDVRIYAFEADPDRCKLTRHKLKDIENIDIYHYAISDMDDNEVIFNRSQWVKDGIEKGEMAGMPGASGSLLKHTAHHVMSQAHLQDFSSQVSIPTISIKRFCEMHGINKIDLMHIDAEGAVVNILNSCEDIMPDMVTAEVAGMDKLYEGALSLKEYHEFFESKGYKLMFRVEGPDYLYIKE